LPTAAEHPGFTIQPLGHRHDRAAFSCGVSSLDNYLHRHASQDLRKHAAVPFVLTPDGTRIAGFYTLSQYAIQLESLPAAILKKLPKYPVVPVTLLGRLAVSLAFRGQGHGQTLLLDALHRSLRSSRELASAGVIVDAKDASAASFYAKYGFLEIPRIEQRLFLPMGTIEMLFR